MALTAPRPDDWRIQQAIVLQSADAAVIRLLKRAQRDINAQLREIRTRPLGVGRDIREAQLNLVRRSLSEQLGRTWRELGNLVEARRAEAVARSIDYQRQLDTFTLLSHGVPGGASVAENIARTEAAQSSQGIDRMMARVSGASYVPLSRRVYNSNVAINSQVDRAVNSAIARGLSADEFAKELEQFINPNTPGGIRYAALRLARTEINNAAHAQAVSSVRDNPWIKRMQWHLSGSHTKPDICNVLATEGPNGDGTYPKEAVPAKPHPQCFCYVTGVTENDDDDDAFLDDLVADYIATNQTPNNPTGAPVAPAPAPTPTTPTQPPRPGASNTTVRPVPSNPLTPEEQARRKRKQIDDAKKMIAAGKSLPDVVAELRRKHGLSNSQALLIWQQANREHKESQPPSPVTATAPVSVRPSTTAATPARVTGESPFAERDDPALEQIVQISEGEIRDRVLQEMRRQNALVPLTTQRLDSVSMATHADRVRESTADALAWYQPWNRQMYLGSEIFSDRYENSVWPNERRVNWCSRTGHSHTGGQSVLAHEFGHHVHNMLDRMPDGDRRRFYNSVAEAMGIQPPASIHPRRIDEWVEMNRYAVINQVSKYAATNIQELMAEVWQEYSTSGEQSRPSILAIGKLMQQLAEQGAGR